MKLIFLGTGTSQGVPMIGSKSPVSRSADPRDNRLRTSAAVVTDNGHVILLDCGPDFRYQMLRAGLFDLDGILFTHAHADHTAGLDDVRPICYFRSHDIDLYAKEDVMESLHARFAYVFATGADRYPGAPDVAEHVITDDPFFVRDVKVTPIPASHGWIGVTGYRIGNMAYLTDVKTMYESSYKLLEGLDVLVLNCLRYSDPHPTHMILPESLEVVRRIAPKKAYFTHISEAMGFAAEAEKLLPEGVHLAYDTLEIEL